MTYSLLRRISLVLSQLALRPLDTARAVAALPRYFGDWRRFKAGNRWEMAAYPCLFDRTQGAASLGEYFWQDLYVARRILEARPDRHVDVGSRIDGFVAHLACQRPLEVYDIRPLELNIPNVRFRQWDLTAESAGGPDEEADSVSCLHTLEHVGLGRYGDPIDPEAWRRGLARLAGIVRPRGCLWLSVPVGHRRVEFNAHRVFDPRELRDSAMSLGLSLLEFSVIDARGDQHFVTTESDWMRFASEPYGLGIFHFQRAASS